MAALKGNEYYKLRSKDGKDKKYPKPSDLLNACNENFEWCINNPLIETVVQKRKTTRDTEIIELVQVPKMREFKIEGLCNFIDIYCQGFYNYKEHGKDYLEIITRVYQIIRNQKFEGAASGFLNPNIIARDLGLKEAHDHSSSDGSMTPKITLVHNEKEINLSNDK